MNVTETAIAALRSEIADIDRQLTRPDATAIDTQIAELKARIAELRAARQANPRAKALRRRRTELSKAIKLITGTAEPGTPRASTRNKGAGACPVCGLEFDTGQGLSMHRRRVHEGFGRQASDAPPARDPDRAVDTLHDHRQPLAEQVELEEARELIEARAS